MSEKTKTIRVGNTTVTVPADSSITVSEVKPGTVLSEAEAVEIARAMGAASPATPTLEERVQQAKAALSGDSSDEALRARAKAMEATMRQARARMGGQPPDDPESIADRTAAARRALGLG